MVDLWTTTGDVSSVVVPPPIIVLDTENIQATVFHILEYARFVLVALKR